MKQVLIITYYWPPSGGGGVMRWLKMSKYLPELGWTPIIFTPENPDASVEDKSLLNEIHGDIQVLKTKIWEPYGIYRKLAGKKKEVKFKPGYISEATSGNWKNKLAVFIRGNLLIPDPRKFWIKPSIKFLKKYLNENPVDLIISTGPPHSMHLIALGLKKLNIPWIADFRDPWTDIDFYSKLRLTDWADKKHRKMEMQVLEQADHVVTVSPGCAAGLKKIKNRKVEVINNGFDPDDFQNLSGTLDKDFTITHFGAFNRDRNPSFLWKALGELSGSSPEFKKSLRIQLIGQTDERIIQDLEQNNLQGNIILTGHMPHKKGLELLAASQVLLLPLNNAPNVQGILPGKMYEYMALKRPILAIGPTHADFAKIISETKSGKALDFNDLEGMKSVISDYFDSYKKNQLFVKSDSFENYSRKNLAKRLVVLVETSD